MASEAELLKYLDPDYKNATMATRIKTIKNNIATQKKEAKVEKFINDKMIKDKNNGRKDIITLLKNISYVL